MQKITNLMVRCLTRPYLFIYFVEYGGSEMLLWLSYTTKEASQFRNKVSKIILAKANVETFNTFIDDAISFKHMF